MAQQRQAGADRFQLPTRPSHHHSADPEPIRSHNKPARPRRAARPYKSLLLIRCLPLALILSLALFLAASLLLLVPNREIERRLDEDGEKKASGSGVKLGLRRSAWPRTLRFGHSGSAGAAGRDSRYWDRDDRRRDREYNGEDESENESGRRDSKNGRSRKDEVNERREKKGGGGGRLYNEGGRAELDSYKEEYEASLRNGGREGKENAGDEDVGIDEYDDGIDIEDEHDEGEKGDGAGSDGGGLLAGAHDGIVGEGSKDVAGKNPKKLPLVVPRRVGSRTEHGLAGGDAGKASGSERKSGSKRKPKREFEFLCM